MLLQVVAPSLADSVAVHDAAVKAGTSVSGWLLTHVFTGMPDKVVGWATLLLATAFGLAASWLWHRVWVAFHARATVDGQAVMTAWWNKWGKLIGILLSALVAGGSSKDLLALLPTILANIPSATFGGVSSVLTNSNAKDVSAGRVGVLLCFLVGGALLLAPHPASAAALKGLAVTDTNGATLSWGSPHRFVYTAAVGESWLGVKATDPPTSYGRLGAGYQVFAPIQLNVGFRRWFEPQSTWRLEGEVRFIYRP